jgi:hypothetical protein
MKLSAKLKRPPLVSASPPAQKNFINFAGGLSYT